jgi:D-alanyl-D-alanine carboxypeptidase (penicillin-binding protein 5/6)
VLTTVTLAGPAYAARDARAEPIPIGGVQLGSADLIYDSTAGVPAPPSVPASGWVVADLDTGQVLAAKNPHGKFGPASTLKVLSALVMLPLLGSTQQIVAPADAVNVTGSKVGVVANHAYTADTLFTGMLVVSGNDAARVLASALGGEDAVAAMMTAKASELQADDTVAKTVSGLDAPGQTTSAYDLALISRAALDIPAFRTYIAIDHTQFSGLDVPGFTITNHNTLLGHYTGAYGVKNGFTNAAQATYVGAAQQNGHHLMVTMVHADSAYRNPAEALLNWGFATDGKVAPVGYLVSPKVPHAVTPADQNTAGINQSITAAGATPQATHSHSGFEYGAIGVGAAVVTLFVYRRRQVKRRRMNRRAKQLRLPNV